MAFTCFDSGVNVFPPVFPSSQASTVAKREDPRALPPSNAARTSVLGDARDDAGHSDRGQPRRQWLQEEAAGKSSQRRGLGLGAWLSHL